MLQVIAEKYGVHTPGARRVGKPYLSKAERKYVNRLKKKYSELLSALGDSRHELLAAASGGDVRELIVRLSEEGHELVAMCLIFNDEQIAVLMELTESRSLAEA